MVSNTPKKTNPGILDLHPSDSRTFVSDLIYSCFVTRNIFWFGQFFELLNEIQENQRLENNGHRTIFLCLHGDTVMFAFYGPPHTKGTDHIGEAGMKHTKQTMKQTIRKQASKQTGKYTSKQANIQQASKQTNKQIKTNNTTPPNKQINKQTNKQTNTKKNMFNDVCFDHAHNMT